MNINFNVISVNIVIRVPTHSLHVIYERTYYIDNIFSLMRCSAWSGDEKLSWKKGERKIHSFGKFSTPSRERKR